MERLLLGLDGARASRSTAVTPGRTRSCPGYPADTSAEGMASPGVHPDEQRERPARRLRHPRTLLLRGHLLQRLRRPGDQRRRLGGAIQRRRPRRQRRLSPRLPSARPASGKGTPSANFNGKFLDKPMLEVDRTGGRFDGNVYMCFTKFPAFGQSEIYFAASSDHGRSFTKPVRVSGAAAGQGCDIAVEHDGDVYVSWRDFEGNSPKKNFGVSVVRSSNAGATWSTPKVIATLPGYNPFDGARDCGDGADACPSGFVFSPRAARASPHRRPDGRAARASTRSCRRPCPRRSSRARRPTPRSELRARAAWSARGPCT